MTPENLPVDSSPPEPPQSPATSQTPRWWTCDPVWPPRDAATLEAVGRAVTSGDWGRYAGGASRVVGETIGKLSGRDHVRLMASGSAAIEWSLRAIGVKAGHRVAISAWDYPGILRAVEICGARAILVDTEADRPTMDAEKLDATIRRAQQDPSAGPVTAVVASHLFGIAADITEIVNICNAHDVPLIEDACQVPGMLIGSPDDPPNDPPNDSPVGDLTAQKWAGSIGHVGVLSFGGSKPLSAGSGGAITTSDRRIASRLGSMLDRPSDASPFSSLQSAALLPQFETLDEFNASRSKTAAHLAEHFPTFKPRRGVRASHYKLAIEVPDAMAQQQATRRAAEIDFPIGQPFRSLDTTSRRRCDRPIAIEHANRLASTTVLLDHRMLMSGPERWPDLVAVIGGVIEGSDF